MSKALLLKVGSGACALASPGSLAAVWASLGFHLSPVKSESAFYKNHVHTADWEAPEQRIIKSSNKLPLQPFYNSLESERPSLQRLEKKLQPKFAAVANCSVHPPSFVFYYNSSGNTMRSYHRLQRRAAVHAVSAQFLHMDLPSSRKKSKAFYPSSG